MVNVAILTAYYRNYISLADIVVPNMQKYCVKHGYSFYEYLIPESEVHYSFKRLKTLRDILSTEDVDFVLCTDIDVLITNYNIRIESFVDSEHDFYICKDVNGINAGVFIVKNTEWAISFLDFILSKQDSFENDQVVIESIKDDAQWKSKIKILPHPTINSYPYDYYAPSWGVIGDRKIERPTNEEGDWKEGDFLIHLPGMSLEKRIEILKEIAVWK